MSFVQRIKDFYQLFRRFVVGKVLSLFAVFFAAISINAGEPVMALAMPGHSQSPEKIFAAGRNDSVEIVRPPSNTSVQETKSDASKSKSGNDFPTHLEKPAGSQRDPLTLVHENLRAARSFEVCVGYEQLWDDSTILPKISGRQDAGCAGVKASFSF
jgi:hypothetical protein